MKVNTIQKFISLIALIILCSCANEYGKLIANNQKKSEEFMKKNMDLEGVKSLKSGVQYKVLSVGNGKKPTLSDEVRIHYRGSLINGEVFDSSYAKLGPQKFKILETIEGWQSVLVEMKENSIWRVFIPPELGYGKKGFDRIGPNEVLIFDIELVEVL